MFILHSLLFFILFLLMIPVVILLLQVIAACFYKHRPQKIITLQHKRPPVAVLMPAHNEELVIAEPINSIKQQLRPDDRIVVVADNCKDMTSSIAKKCGATVIERSNQSERGKGYALDFGLQYLKTNAPAVVIIVDADCVVHENTIELLTAACLQSQRPTQALNLMNAQPNPNLKASIAAFAWRVKNKVRPLGYKALGLPCQLMGTGMAFLWRDISETSLSSGHIVEDMKLGTDLAKRNKVPLFLHEALVTSVFPPSEAAANTQRTRWEHGHINIILNEVPKLILDAITNKNKQVFGMACDFLVPPLAMLTLMCLIVTTVSILFGTTLIIFLAMTLLGCLLLAILIAWAKFGKDIISFKQLCYAPIYTLVKIPIYIKYFINPQVEWIRSERE